MIDVVEGIPQGKALDQWQSAPIEGFDARVIGTNGYDEAAGADIVRRHRRHRAEAGHEPRRPGQDQRRHRALGRRADRAGGAQGDHHRGLEPARRDVLRGHEGQRLPARARDRHGRRARHRALPHVPGRGAGRLGRGHPGDGARRPRRHDGSAGLLHDRLRHPGHPADRPPTSSTRSSTARGTAAPRSSRFLKTGSAYYAPSAAAVQMVEAIALDKRRILPCSAWLQGEFGLRDVFCGVPCKLGRNGLEQILEVTLTDAERAELHEVGRGGARDPGRRRRRLTGDASMNRVRGASGASSVGKKVVMAVTGLIMVAYLIIATCSATCWSSRVRQRDQRLQRGSCTATRRARSGPRGWCCSWRWCFTSLAAVSAHGAATARPGRSATRRREPQVSTLAVAHDALGRRAASSSSSSSTSCTSRLGTVHPAAFVEGDLYAQRRRGLRTIRLGGACSTSSRMVAARPAPLSRGLEQRSEPGPEPRRRRIRSGGSSRWCSR